jgi:hypothetical protein
MFFEFADVVDRRSSNVQRLCVKKAFALKTPPFTA